MRITLTQRIMIGLVLGIALGWGLHSYYLDSPELLGALAKNISTVSDSFLQLIKMIIAPLVFATLVSGIAHMGDTSSLGRIGARTMGWFIGATIVSLTLGLILVNVLQPGVGGTELVAQATGAPADLEKSAINFHDVVVHIFPKSVIEAMSKNDILPIVVFSLFFGVAVSSLGEKAAPIAKAVDALVDVMLKITGWVMAVAPFAVFAAMAAAITKNGPEIIGKFILFVGSFYLGLAVLWCALILAGMMVIGGRMRGLLMAIKDPILLAFSTASSEAAYPRTLEALEKIGVPPRIASFVLPLGYSFNLDGSMMYMTFATLFIAQLYGMHLSAADQITMVLILMISSKGMAGVPRASLVVISGVMMKFGIPEAGLALILGVDQFLDMGRSGTNVVGNAIATAVVAKWEGALDTPAPTATLVG
ncbi:MAG: hypothetical protein RL367_327 [Pseudomonadota bacterium]